MSTLFAAFKVATGRVAHTSRQRGIASLDFPKEIVSAALHGGFDNLNTYRPESDGWLARHYLHSQLTLTRASCVYQSWFSRNSHHALPSTGQVTLGADSTPLYRPKRQGPAVGLDQSRSAASKAPYQPT